MESIRIVLVGTTHPGNIGGAARAMKNMGLSELCLVSPRRFPDAQADWRAAGAADVLRRASVVASLEEAIADCHFVVGASARGRRIPWPALDPRRCAAEIRARATAGARAAVLFGREDRGLLNDELRRCHLHLRIPSHEAYRSLNLAMAVQVVAYELRMLEVAADLPASAEAQWDAPLATAEDMERYFAHLERTLVAIGFLDPAAPRQLMTRLRRLYARIRPDSMELNILRGILTETGNALARGRQ